MTCGVCQEVACLKLRKQVGGRQALRSYVHVYSCMQCVASGDHQNFGLSQYNLRNMKLSGVLAITEVSSTNSGPCSKHVAHSRQKGARPLNLGRYLDNSMWANLDIWSRTRAERACYKIGRLQRRLRRGSLYLARGSLGQRWSPTLVGALPCHS